MKYYKNKYREIFYFANDKKKRNEISYYIGESKKGKICLKDNIGNQYIMYYKDRPKKMIFSY